MPETGESDGNVQKPRFPSYQINPPENFDFSQPEEWPKWVRRFERFRIAAGLTSGDEESQVNTLI